MALPERRHTVVLHDRTAGVLHQWGDFTRFVMSEEYWRSPDRPVLGLQFEDNPRRQPAAALRLPAWFSNLLPEGRLRQWIAEDRRVPVEREMELLAQVGHDLPGAVQLLPDLGAIPPPSVTPPLGCPPRPREERVRFSLAGVGLKFSMLQVGERLTLPAHGEGGDWIVKLPDAVHPGVPVNEAAMMSWAGRCGIDVPEHKLFRRDALPTLPDIAWPGSETLAYAVRRFDRAADRSRIHIEDFAQVRDFYPDDKYYGDFATVAALAYRGHDLPALQEFVRRLAFNVVIGNGDAHLKNWSLIYPDRRRARLSPVYDVVSTAPYRPHGDEDLGLKFMRSKRFDLVRPDYFSRLERRLGLRGANLADLATHTAQRALDSLEAALVDVNDVPIVRDWLAAEVPRRAAWLTAR